MGEDWKVTYNPKQVVLLGGENDDRGVCNIEKKTIYISPKLKGRELIDTMIHELLHGYMWWLDEDYVEEISSNIAKILTRMGFSS